MPDDAELLRRYAAENSEAAFAELVARHLGFVYACALRRVGGDAGLAEDVCQQVFTLLARQARELATRPVLAGWLFTTARFTSARIVRGERRRQAREKEASLMREIFSDDPAPPDWERLRPVLDAALDHLGERDREAVLMRFFERRTFGEIGVKLGLTENAARMRVERALDKLHGLLARRGVTSTAAALGVALAAQPMVAMPAGLAASVTGAALAGASAVAAGGSGAVVVNYVFMGMTKIQLGVAAALLIAGGATLVIQESAKSGLEFQIAEQRRERAALASVAGRPATPGAGVGAGVVDPAADATAAPSPELAQLQREGEALRARLSAAQAAKPASNRRAAEVPFTGAFFEARDLDVQPKAVFQARPVYPDELRKSGARGETVIDLIVDAQGKVQNARIASTTNAAAGDSALEAVRNWEFAAGQKNGGVVAAHLQIPVNFVVVAEDAAAKPAGATAGKRANSGPAWAPWF